MTQEVEAWLPSHMIILPRIIRADSHGTLVRILRTRLWALPMQLRDKAQDSGNATENDSIAVDGW